MLIIDIFISFGIVFLLVIILFLLGNRKRRYIDTYLSGERIKQTQVKYKVRWIYYGSFFISFDAVIILIAITSLSLNIITVIFLVLISLSLFLIPKEDKINA